MVAGSSAGISAPGTTQAPRQDLDGGGASARSTSRAWTIHLLVLLGTLLCLMAIAGRGVFTIDEAAYRVQAELLDEGRWGLPYPSAGIVDQKLGAPLANSELGDSLWYPAARHPAYAALLNLSTGIAGYYGPLLISILGVMLTAVGVEQTTRWLGGVPRWLGFWVAGIGGPVTIHGLLAWAHAPAAGLGAIGLASLLRSVPSDVPDRASGRRPAVAGAVLLAGSILLRGEAVLLVAAVVAALLVASTNDRRYLHRAVLTGAASLVGFFANAAWRGVVVDSTAVSGAGTGRSVDASRYASTAFEILLSPGAGGLGLLRLLSIVLLAITVVWFRRHRDDELLVTYTLAGLALAAGVIGSPQLLPYGALAPAFPLLAVGLPAIGLPARGQSAGGQRRPEAGGADVTTSALTTRHRRLVLAVIAGLTIGAPIVASVSGGGGLGWGGRYALLALVALIPLTVDGCAALLRQPATRPLLAAALLVTAAVQLNGIRTVRNYHDLSLEAGAHIEAGLVPLAADVDLIIATDPRIGRLAPTAAVTVPLVTVPGDEEVNELLVIAAAEGVQRIAVVAYQLPVPTDVPAPWSVVDYRDQPFQVLVATR